MVTATRLEHLPTEIKIDILYLLSDIATLSAIVHASPTFHNAYTIDREKILTRTTFRQLRARAEIVTTLKPKALWILKVHGKQMDFNLRSTIEFCCTKARAGKLDKIKLSVNQCIALGTVKEASNYDVPAIDAKYPWSKGPEILIYVSGEETRIVGRTDETPYFKVWEVEWSEFLKDIFFR